MGTMLGREGTIEERSGSFDEKQLGDLGVLPVATIAAGSSLVAPVGRFFKGIFSGGSRCTSQINQQKQELRALIEEILDSSDRRRLVSGTESNVSPTPAAMAEFFFGGRDCLHKNVSPGDQRFLDRLPVVLQEKAQALEAERQQAEQEKIQQPGQTGSGSSRKVNQQAPAAMTTTAGFSQTLNPALIGIGTLIAGGVVVLLILR